MKKYRITHTVQFKETITIVAKNKNVAKRMAYSDKYIWSRKGNEEIVSHEIEVVLKSPEVPKK